MDWLAGAAVEIFVYSSENVAVAVFVCSPCSLEWSMLTSIHFLPPQYKIEQKQNEMEGKSGELQQLIRKSKNEQSEYDM